MALDNNELFEISGGGFSLTSTAINAFSRLVTTFVKLGQLVGSSIRRAVSKNYC